MQTLPRFRFRAALLALLLSILSPNFLFSSNLAASAIAGRFDLSKLGPGDSVALEGAWGFFWRRFVDPAEPGLADSFVPLPGVWKDYDLPGIESLGYASYSLQISGLDPELDLGIKLPSFLNAARIFADGRQIDLQGFPGRTAEEEEPGWSSRVVRLGPQADGNLLLLIQVSNWSDRTGGGRQAPILGDYEAVRTARERTVVLEIFLVGAILVMGLYYLFLHLFRRIDLSSLYFSLLCLVLAARILCYDEYYLLDLIPGLPWIWLFRIGFLSFPLALALFAGLFQSLFPRLFAPWILAATALTSAVYSVFILFAPPLWIASGNPLFQVFTLILGVFIVVLLGRSIFLREKGSLILGLGFLVLFAAVLRDILVSNGLLGGPFMLQLGLLGFLFAMSLVITRKFAAAFTSAETLSADLARANAAMRRFVPAQFLERLGRSRIEEVALGDHIAEEMTVLFADINSFTKLSEELGPEGTFGFINEYLERVGPVVRSHRGFVDKYFGDGIMALFPEAPEDALLCAIEMQRRIAAYNEEREGAGKKPIAVGMGIHTGRIMLGTIGDSERMDGTVISDAVNLASRVEGVAKLYSVGIAVSERVLLGLDDPGIYRLRFLGKVGVKGKRDPLSVFEVYDGDPEARKAAKDGIRGPFEKALADFYRQSYREAFEGFKKVLDLLPGDEASLHYIRIIRKLEGG